MAAGLKFDILTHVLVPKHKLLNEAEVKKLLDDYNIAKLQLPEISVDDPVIEKIGGKEGDVVQITRDNVKKEIYFRRIVK